MRKKRTTWKHGATREPSTFSGQSESTHSAQVWVFLFISAFGFSAASETSKPMTGEDHKYQPMSEQGAVLANRDGSTGVGHAQLRSVKPSSLGACRSDTGDREASSGSDTLGFISHTGFNRADIRFSLFNDPQAQGSRSQLMRAKLTEALGKQAAFVSYGNKVATRTPWRPLSPCVERGAYIIKPNQTPSESRDKKNNFPYITCLFMKTNYFKSFGFNFNLHKRE